MYADESTKYQNLQLLQINDYVLTCLDHKGLAKVRMGQALSQSCRQHELIWAPCKLLPTGLSVKEWQRQCFPVFSPVQAKLFWCFMVTQCDWLITTTRLTKANLHWGRVWSCQQAQSFICFNTSRTRHAELRTTRRNKTKDCWQLQTHPQCSRWTFKVNHIWRSITITPSTLQRLRAFSASQVFDYV